MSEIVKGSFTPIDIKSVVYHVNPLLGKLIPSFMYRYFERLLHIEELNGFFCAHSNDDAQTFLDDGFEFLGFQIDFQGHGLEQFEKLAGQHVLVVSNHPYGGPEAIGLMSYLHRIFPDIKLVAQGFLRFITALDECCVYNKKGVDTTKAAIERKDSLLIYPSGYCSRRLSNKEIFDYEWKKAFVKIARKNNMPIVVVHTDGQLTDRIHRWTAFRNFFHIKTSFETVYLVDEMFRLRGQRLRMVIGDVIYPDQLSKEITSREWADRIRQYCYELRADPTLRFDPQKIATLIKK